MVRLIGRPRNGRSSLCNVLSITSTSPSVLRKCSASGRMVGTIRLDLLISNGIELPGERVKVGKDRTLRLILRAFHEGGRSISRPRTMAGIEWRAHPQEGGRPKWPKTPRRGDSAQVLLGTATPESNGNRDDLSKTRPFSRTTTVWTRLRTNFPCSVRPGLSHQPSGESVFNCGSRGKLQWACLQTAA